jgi:hypothetical protein
MEFPSEHRKEKELAAVERCAKHPDRETPYKCLKHNIAMCRECLHCKDPHIYCKFRPSCPIHFMEKRDRNGEFFEEQPSDPQKGEGCTETAA